ncbi:hypothetical protein [Embleya sp. NBC_00896]|uniref:hypothetical protein n=1 Tax=Embleya sp. NBC_00896 TaxID=2975961 RepID=UPI002F90F20C|nr:hypothetical protein OG928_43260 [Embleya sp. NBC_00896]
MPLRVVPWARRDGRIMPHTLRGEDPDARFDGFLDSVPAAVGDECVLPRDLGWRQ